MTPQQQGHTTLQDAMQPMIQNALNLVEHNLNSSFAGHVSDILQTNGVSTSRLWQPSIDMIETFEDLRIYVTIPGVKSQNLDIDFFNNLISIKGIREFPSADTNILSRRQEIIYGNFERRITMPISVTRRDSVTLTAEDGILLISVNKAMEMENRFTMRPVQNEGNQANSGVEEESAVGEE